MKKLLGIVVLGLLYSNISIAENKCTDSPIPFSKESFKFIQKKWNNCFGTVILKYNNETITYEGHFTKGKLNFGTQLTPEGKYVGYFDKYFRYHGKGVLDIIKDKIKVYGEFKKGKPSKNDDHLLIIKDVGFYIGAADEKMQFNGFGVLLAKDGEKYFGHFKKHLKHGEGVHIYPDGRVEAGIWKNDKLIKKDKYKKIEKKSLKEHSKIFNDLVEQVEIIKKIYDEGGLTKQEYTDVKKILLN